MNFITAIFLKLNTKIKFFLFYFSLQFFFARVGGLACTKNKTKKKRYRKYISAWRGNNIRL